MDLTQLEIGAEYYVFVTTPDGLYRYDMNDVVGVTGKFNATPTLAFVQKGKGVTSITGEKLYESHLLAAVANLQRQLNIYLPFFLMWADEQASRYTLVAEFGADVTVNPATVAEIVDGELVGLNIEYAAKRHSRRLSAVQCIPVQINTGEEYRRSCVEAGQHDAQFKIVHLQYRRDVSFDFGPFTHAGSGA